MNELFDRLQHALGDEYRLEKELGGGGMSRVFLATEVSLNRSVVIKLLAPELTSEVSTARFKREFEVTALLQHPNILPVLATGARDGLLYYIMPYVVGESLRHRMQREGKLPVADAVRILSELSDALAYAHQRGVVHRDIKPENILLSNGHAVLADFGIAAALAGPRSGEGGERLTELGMAMGTPGYMSPEQAAGESTLDARSDIYALAVVGYEMLSGSPPFVGPTPLAVLTAHLSETPKPIEIVRPETPSALALALSRALAKSPGERWQTAAEFNQSLGISFTGSATPMRFGVFGRRRRHWVMALAAALVLIVGVAYALTRGREPAVLDENLVAIAPFDVIEPNLAVWEEGLVDVISANLDGAGPIRTVSPAVIVRRWSGSADRESAAALGHETGAGLTVFGRLLASGADSVRVRATILDVGAGRAIGEMELSESTNHMDRLADSLSIRILRELNQTRALSAVRRAAIGSTSVLAVKAYLQGEQHYRRSDWDSAVVYYQRAIQQDSNFAPALRHLSNALGWKLSPTGQFQSGTYDFALRAGSKNVGLAPRESLLVASDSLFAAVISSVNKVPYKERVVLAGRLLDMLGEGTQRFRDDPEVWFKLGDARYHFWSYLPSKENLGRAREAFDRSIALDSAFAPTFVHVIDLAVKQQDVAGAKRYIKQYLALNPGDVHAVSMRMLDQLLDPVRQREIDLDTLFKSVPPQVIQHTFGAVLYLADSNETQVRMARALEKTSQNASAPAELRNNAHQAVMVSLSYRGHLREAMQIADSAHLWSFVDAAMLGVYPSDSANLLFDRWFRAGRWRRVVETLPYWAERRDTAKLLEIQGKADSLVRFGVPTEVTRGYLALARGDTARAIELFTRPDSTCPGGCLIARFPLARLLAARNRHAEAVAILDQEFVQPTAVRIIWMLERGRVNEKVGNRAKAIDSYSFVANAWQRADPELEPFVKEARDALRRLSTDPPRAGG